MATATARRLQRSAPVAAAPADALDLTPAQRTALHQVYQLILSFAQPDELTRRRKDAEEEREKSGAMCPSSSPLSATLCASAPLRQNSLPERRQGGRP